MYSIANTLAAFAWVVPWHWGLEGQKVPNTIWTRCGVKCQHLNYFSYTMVAIYGARSFPRNNFKHKNVPVCLGDVQAHISRVPVGRALSWRPCNQHDAVFGCSVMCVSKSSHADFAALLGRCLNKNFEQRYDSSQYVTCESSTSSNH